MPLTIEQLGGLLGMVAGTVDEEITCEECLDGMAEFAENELAGLGTDEAVTLVQAHIDFCPECREEYEALIAALQAVGHRRDDPSGTGASDT